MTTPPANRPALDALTLELLSRRLHNELGFRLVAVAALDPGRPHNNRLLYLMAADGRQAVVKHYFADARQRLDREYETLMSLRAHRMTVPTPLLRDDAHAFAVFSFEPGSIQAGTALTAPAVRAIARFAAQLYHIHPDPDSAATNLRTAVSATFSLAQQVAGIRRRLGEFQELASSPQAGSAIHALQREIAIEDEVEQLVRRALDGRPLTAIERRVPQAAWSLTSGDLAPHNILVRDGDSICVLDFEYSGWDDPAILLADFLSADSARGLSDACRRAFVDTFRDLTDPSPDTWQHILGVRSLMEVSWAVLHLSLVVPRRLAAKQFADPGLDTTAYVAEQIDKFRRRLAGAAAVIDDCQADRL